jgi:hypothetical protein
MTVRVVDDVDDLPFSSRPAECICLRSGLATHCPALPTALRSSPKALVTFLGRLPTARHRSILSAHSHSILISKLKPNVLSSWVMFFLYPRSQPPTRCSERMLVGATRAITQHKVDRLGCNSPSSPARCTRAKRLGRFTTATARNRCGAIQRPTGLGAFSLPSFPGRPARIISCCTSS